eukprot:CAMPEP_0176190132 /NCGR_PEP_ID=MMETSP0121_2-20121125/3783_1 /TAXON_ID=160619 /ORGANISM="Kryptoperidinium foliaceum, Strain CCMP 1326" /LENGTH=142 /DNA_ID=CAMNT_0017528749 /DNA_START=18 /DNA_END=443 /DNA_ORIENTATION=+
MELALNDPETFVKDARCADALSEVLAWGLGISKSKVSTVLRLLSVQPLNGSLSGGVAADQSILVTLDPSDVPVGPGGSGCTGELTTKLTAMKEITPRLQYGLADEVGKGVYKVSVTKTEVLSAECASLAGRRAGMSLAAAAL